MMAEFVEIDFDSRYVLISKKPLDPGLHEYILATWNNFTNTKTPTLLVIDGTQFELVKKEK